MIENIMQSIVKQPAFCSWSGGKDSCLSLYYAVQQGGLPRFLFTMLTEGGRISRSHGLPISILKAQAQQLGLPIVFKSAAWKDYETVFSELLYELKGRGVSLGVFGDIDIDEHRDWCIRLCEGCGMKAFHPLWKRPRKELLSEFLHLGFKAIIVVTKADRLGREWLGRTVDEGMIKELEDIGVDVCGELGEYHTVVIDGPLFKSAIKIETGEATLCDGHWHLAVSG